MRIATSFVLLLSTASAAFAYSAVISKGLWTGIDRTRPGASLEEIFKYERNHVTATSSLLQYYGADSNYVPRDLKPEKGSASYEVFKLAVQESPAFVLVSHNAAQLRVDGDLDALQDTIREGYPFRDGKLVALNLRSSVPDKSHDLHGEQEVLFSLVEIFKPSSEPHVTVRLIELPLTLITDDNARVELKKQETTLSTDTFAVDDNWLHEHAELLVEYVKKATTAKKFAEIFTTQSEDEDEDEGFGVFQWVSSLHKVYRQLPF